MEAKKTSQKATLNTEKRGGIKRTLGVVYTNLAPHLRIATTVEIRVKLQHTKQKTQNVINPEI